MSASKGGAKYTRPIGSGVSIECGHSAGPCGGRVARPGKLETVTLDICEGGPGDSLTKLETVILSQTRPTLESNNFSTMLGLRICTWPGEYLSFGDMAVDGLPQNPTTLILFHWEEAMPTTKGHMHLT